jgi:hypothetical protein
MAADQPTGARSVSGDDFYVEIQAFKLCGRVNWAWCYNHGVNEMGNYVASASQIPVSSNGAVSPVLHEEILRDPNYPVHKIANQLVPYLRVLLENFHPEQVILFGSYAYGDPNEHSDVDLLIIKPLKQSPVREAISMRKAWRPVRATVGPLPFDLIVTSPEDHQHRLSHSAGFYEEIVQRGLRVA